MRNNHQNHTPPDPLADAEARASEARTALASVRARAASLTAPEATMTLLERGGAAEVVRLRLAVDQLPVEIAAAELALCWAEETVYRLRHQLAEEDFNRACIVAAEVEKELREVNERYARACSEREGLRYQVTEHFRLMRERRRRIEDINRSMRSTTAPLVRSLPHSR